MKGCRAVQALVPKGHVENWKPEEDDQDFERESDFFLSGIGDGSPDEGPLDNMEKVRHGLRDVIIYNTCDDVGLSIIVFLKTGLERHLRCLCLAIVPGTITRLYFLMLWTCPRLHDPAS